MMQIYKMPLEKQKTLCINILGGNAFSVTRAETEIFVKFFRESEALKVIIDEKTTEKNLKAQLSFMLKESGASERWLKDGFIKIS